jgi:hypothetical protein
MFDVLLNFQKHRLHHIFQTNLPPGGAEIFLCTLAKQRAGTCLYPLLEQASAVLQNANTTSSPADVYGALLLLGKVATTLMKVDESQQKEQKAASATVSNAQEAALSAQSGSKGGKFILKDFKIHDVLKNFVFPLLSSPHAFVRFRACWVYGCFADLLKPTANDSTMAEPCKKIVELLINPTEEEGVQVNAGICLSSFLRISHTDKIMVSTAIEPNLKQILLKLIEFLQSYTCIEELPETLRILFKNNKQIVFPYVCELIRELVNAFVANQNNPNVGGENDADFVYMQSQSTLQSLVSLVRMQKISSQGSIYYPIIIIVQGSKLSRILLLTILAFDLESKSSCLRSENKNIPKKTFPGQNLL